MKYIKVVHRAWNRIICIVEPGNLFIHSESVNYYECWKKNYSCYEEGHRHWKQELNFGFVIELFKRLSWVHSFSQELSMVLLLDIKELDCWRSDSLKRPSLEVLAHKNSAHLASVRDCIANPQLRGRGAQKFGNTRLKIFARDLWWQEPNLIDGSQGRLGSHWEVQQQPYPKLVVNYF